MKTELRHEKGIYLIDLAMHRLASDYLGMKLLRGGESKLPFSGRVSGPPAELE